MKCPRCGKVAKGTAVLGGPGHETPPPGAIGVCAGCGAFVRVTDAEELEALDELPADMPSEMVRALKIGRLYTQKGKGKAEGYAFAAAMTMDIVAGFVAQDPEELPRFAAPKGVALLCGLDELGPRMARNPAAGELLLAILGYFRRIKTEPPTVTMLRMALEKSGIETEDCSPADLGLEFPKA